MASRIKNFSVIIPHVAREIVWEIEQGLNRHFGMPMSLSLPTDEAMGTDETPVPGQAVVYFPGAKFVVGIETGIGHFGRFVTVRRIEAAVKFHSEAAAKKWFRGVKYFAGPTEHTFESPHGSEGKLKFVLEGVALDRLKMNASNRRNDLPTYKWNSPRSPLNGFPTWQETTPAKRAGVMLNCWEGKQDRAGGLRRFLRCLTAETAGVPKFRQLAQVSEPVTDQEFFSFFWAKMSKGYEKTLRRRQRALESVPSI